jgi:hypothetical protein
MSMLSEWSEHQAPSMVGPFTKNGHFREMRIMAETWSLTLSASRINRRHGAWSSRE